ncbi:hypothetical protein NPIL_382721 [Nephila pilipes]|uniref:Uncharacterized protein n=1 Tax=Nephila pilipes TaxID=299642 RepID=A0A8X6QC84_NEPPI|nr:hypothetical protein NPIL_382721 [Nephila pilipes]
MKETVRISATSIGYHTFEKAISSPIPLKSPDQGVKNPYSYLNHNWLLPLYMNITVTFQNIHHRKQSVILCFKLLLLS